MTHHRPEPDLLTVAAGWADPAGWPVALRFDPVEREIMGYTRVVEAERDGAVDAAVLRQTVRGPRAGEEPPYVRHDETPLRVLISAEPETAEAASEMLAEEYGVVIPASELADDVNAALFGVPNEDGELVPLHGDYVIQVRAALAQPEDTIEWVRAVAGGGTFGLLGTDTSGRDLAQGLAFGLRTFIADLPNGIDPCGENGEFHTCTVNGPAFREPLRIETSETAIRDGFAYTDQHLL